MAVTLEQAKKNTQDKLSPLVIDEFRKSSFLLDHIPFDDCVEAAHKAGISAIIQPGGSVRDQDSIDACNKYGIPMIFTGMRHFKH